MPKITYYTAAAKKVITQFYESDSFRTETQTAHTMTFDDKKGALVVITGQDFEYSHGQVISGEVTSVEMRSKEGDLLETVGNLQLDAATVFQSFF
eukprot:gene13882-18388_t